MGFKILFKLKQIVGGLGCILFALACFKTSSVDAQSVQTKCASFYQNKNLYDGPTFGPEFTFVGLSTFSSLGVLSIGNIRARDELAREILKKCEARGDCSVTRKFRKWFLGRDQVIQYNDGFWIRVSTDNDVVEVQTSPLTLNQFKNQRDRIQTDLFDSAEAIGLKPSTFGKGGGHIHMGIKSAFNEDVLLFRNFLVDVLNHSAGALGADQVSYKRNAERLNTRQAAQDRFERVINDFDNGKYRTIEELSWAIVKRVYLWQVEGMRFQEINLLRVLGFAWNPAKRTIEFRGVDPQQNIDVFLKQIEIFHSRLEYLKTLQGRIQYRNRTLGGQPNQISGLYGYVVGSGLDWSNFKEVWTPYNSREDRDLNPPIQEALENVILEHTPHTKKMSEKYLPD